MTKRRYSLLLVPDDRGQINQFRITSTQVRIVVIGLCLLLAVTAFLAFQYFGRVRDALAMTQLREENAYLWSRVTELDSSIVEFQTQMGTLVEMEKTLRIMADLPAIDPDIRKVGVGGQRLEDLDGPLVSLREQGSSPDLALGDVDRLLRQVKLETQSFLEIKAALEKKDERFDCTPTIWPTSGYVSRGYGTCTDPFTGQRRKHEGLDVVNRIGTPVVATAAGKVIERGRQDGYGWTVVIDHGFGYQTAYGHLDSIVVTKGERVERGQLIGTLGNSGRSTGPHLHYEVRVAGRPVNPYKYILPDVIVD
jgi:hypothetical protein